MCIPVGYSFQLCNLENCSVFSELLDFFSSLSTVEVKNPVQIISTTKTQLCAGNVMSN